MRIALLFLTALALPVPAGAQTAAPTPTAVATTPLVGGADFVSPMGEPVRSHDTLSGAEHWFAAADTNHDGRLTLAEFRADAARFFATLDVDHNHEIGPDEIERYETEVAPEIRVISTYGDASLAKTDDDGTVTDPPYPTRLGAGRFGYLDMPEPVVSADANLDRAISPQEFDQAAQRRFAMLDTNGDGAITRDELPKLDATRGGGKKGRRGGGGSREMEGGRHHGGMGGDGGMGGGGMGGMGGGGMGTNPY
jgi:Ca2+-binding EF-hand superfamily protein